ncbi:MAG: hypothetical protein GX842_02310 [Spirochaetales bacterium]|jgi:hypothetical protein|nr:hypothetical protein [Spirochaetales bacterium]
MNHKIKRVLFLIVIILLLTHTLFSAITATYVPANPVYFKKGNEVSTPNTPAGSFPSNKLVAHLGTVTITKGPNDRYWDPFLVNIGTADNISFIGPYVSWDGYQVQTTQLTVHGKSSMQSSPVDYWLSDETWPLQSWHGTEITDNPYVVDFFLKSRNDTSNYDENGIYTIPSGELGSFNIRITTDLNNKVTEYISINGQEIPPGGDPPATSVPIPEGGPGAPITDIPVGDVPTPLMYHINIRNEPPFDLSRSYDSSGVKVATTEVVIGNGEVGVNYNLQVKFTNPQNTADFTLRPKNQPQGYSIPYSLRFGDINGIKGGTLYDWNNLLSTNVNSKELKIYNLNKSRADQAPAGVFEDTITVEILTTN